MGVTPTENYWRSIPGWFDFADLYSFAVMQVPDNAHFLEIGCLLGRSTCFLAEAIVRSGKDISLTVVDAFIESPDEVAVYLTPFGGSVRAAFEANIRNAGFESIVKVFAEDSKTAHRHFAEGSLDFVFIDGDHSYEGVKLDIQNFLPKVRPGGLIAGHDYEHSPIVRKAVEEIFGPCPVSVASWAKRV